MNNMMPLVNRFKESFIEAKKSRVDIVRVATYMHDAGKTEPLVSYLKSQGYIVCINLMKISESSETEIENTVKQINQWGFLHYLHIYLMTIF